MRPPARGEIVRLFQSIEEAFPHLQMSLQLEHRHVDLNMDMPEQDKLRFDVKLNLQGDELHLSAGNFWLEWFPCTDEQIAGAFVESVAGLLSGWFRILERYRGSRAVKAELQRPVGDGWETIGTWSPGRFPYLGARQRGY